LAVTKEILCGLPAVTVQTQHFTFLACVESSDPFIPWVKLGVFANVFPNFNSVGESENY